MAQVDLRFSGTLSSLVLGWTKELSTIFSWTFTKSVLILLIWNFLASTPYNMYFLPLVLYNEVEIFGIIIVTALFSVVNILSPVAGYLGDLKYSRFSVLKCGSRFMIAATLIGFLSLAIILASFVQSSNISILLWLIYSSMISASVLYLLGYLLFSANFIQFSTDQLRDAPTKCSVIFLYAMLWSNSFSKTISATKNFDWSINATVTSNLEPYITTKLSSVCIALILFGLTFLLSVIAILVIQWKRKWFLTDKIRGNPYRLVVKVLLFALRHKSPIRRSAFTFCENEPPSRFDFSKRRYGGPYTTEQVEDVKVLLNIVKLLVSLGPVFLLDYSANLSSINFNILVDHLDPFILSPGVLSQVIIFLTIPFYVFLLKPLLERCVPKLLPNFFKRMGLSIFFLTMFFIVYLLYDGFAYSSKSSMFENCSKNRSSILNKSYVYIPQGYLTILQATLLALSHILLNISVWEFICCQSPQHMKGLSFGLSLAIRAFMQFLAAIILVPFAYYWKPHVIGCRTGYSLLHILVGTVTIALFGLTAKRYKYRKRDDICNVYQFAEDYYSK